jgi:hypothetical protein
VENVDQPGLLVDAALNAVVTIPHHLVVTHHLIVATHHRVSRYAAEAAIKEVPIAATILL